jgi:hypothetical protein
MRESYFKSRILALTVAMTFYCCSGDSIVNADGDTETYVIFGSDGTAKASWQSDIPKSRGSNTYRGFFWAEKEWNDDKFSPWRFMMTDYAIVPPNVANTVYGSVAGLCRRKRYFHVCTNSPLPLDDGKSFVNLYPNNTC